MAWFRVRLTEEEQRVVNEERCCHPNLRIREKMLVLWLLHNGLDASASGQGCRSQSGHRPAVRGRVSAGAWTACGSGISNRPVSEMAAYRELIRCLREATSHDHRRGVRTHLPTDRAAPRAQPGLRKFLKDLGLKLRAGSAPSPCRRKTWPSTSQTEPLSRNRTEATPGRRPSR